MRRGLSRAAWGGCVGLCFAAALSAATTAPSGFPFTDESLTYSINWPSGLSLGEGHMRARKTAGEWELELTLNAAIPGFSISDRYRSSISPAFCSLNFEKDLTHGKRKSRERIAFDYRKGMARRVTAEGGGKTELPVDACARDALNFLYFARRELGQGRVPPPQTVLFGSSYQVRMEYTGPQVVAANDRQAQADRVAVYVKGPASDVSFEMFFARDAARTPLVIRVPFAMGTFSMELVR